MMELDTAYWMVRKAIVVTVYFGGLRMVECMNLELEKIVRGPEGFTITHSRAKQRSDKMSTKFLVPQVGGYADILSAYLEKVKNQLDKHKGKVWFTGRKYEKLTSQAMGKNMVFKVPHEIAELLGLPNPSSFTFHSFRRTSATMAAHAGATTEQLVDFFGWKNASMCQEYISSSKPAILGMANRLTLAQQEDKNTLAKQEDDNYFFANMEEDREMYVKAGIPLTNYTVTTHTSTGQQGMEEANMQHGMEEASFQHSMVENSIQQAMTAIPHVDGANINLKVVVVNNMSGNISL